MVSQKTLHSIPNIESLKLLAQSLAMLDAIMSPERESRYYSFNSQWNVAQMMASMWNGSGDDYFILFNPVGAILEGFDHESEMSPYALDGIQTWPGVLSDVPPQFHDFLSESAFSIEASTFCIWRRFSDSSWQVGTITYPSDDPDADGSGWLLSILDGDPSSYKEFAEEYYEQTVDLEAVKAIYEHRPLTEAIVRALNPEISLKDLKVDVEEIGYPMDAI